MMTELSESLLFAAIWKFRFITSFRDESGWLGEKGIIIRRASFRGPSTRKICGFRTSVARNSGLRTSSTRRGSLRKSPRLISTWIPSFWYLTYSTWYLVGAEPWSCTEKLVAVTSSSNCFAKQCTEIHLSSSRRSHWATESNYISSTLIVISYSELLFHT